MKLFPTSLAVALVAGWCLLAVASVFWPGLGVALAIAAAVALVAFAGDAVASGRSQPPTISRVLPAFALQGRAAHLELVVRNRASRAIEIDLSDELPRDLLAEDPRFDRVVIESGAAAVFGCEVEPARRGDRLLGAPIALVRSPLGLWRRRCAGSAGAVLPVRPDTSQLLRRETLDPKHVLALLGVKAARARGEGSEFDSLREYVAGDDPRHIDWKATARRAKLVSRVHRHERSHTVVIALDASRLMAARSGSSRKIDRAIEAALALAYTALVHGDRVGLVVFDRVVRGRLVPRAHRRQLGPMVELLRHVEPRIVEADHAALVHTLATAQRQRALVVVLTDFVEAESERFSTPLAVLARRHRTLLVALRDPIYAELDPTSAPPRAPRVHRRIAIDDLLHERELALAVLRRHGAQTLDLAPESVTAPVLNRYLALRFGADR